jgi:Ca2+-binding EF-hand superfamily protein
MAIADTDGSGTIDIEEFKEFIVKLDSSIGEDTIKSSFDGQDEEKNGELSVENFGKALFDIIKDMKADN